ETSAGRALEEPRGADPYPLPEGNLDRRLRGSAGGPRRRRARSVGIDHRPPQGGVDRRTCALAEARSVSKALRLLLAGRAVSKRSRTAFAWNQCTVDLTIFPASRENTGNFAYFACWEQPNDAEYRKDNNALRENSRRPRTGKFRVSSGN